MTEVMTQEAPYPKILAELVAKLRYKRGWRFYLGNVDRGQGSKGLTLIIEITGSDSYHPEQQITVNHYMLVPPAAYDGRSWRRWLFEQILLVERHEAMEFFTLVHRGPFIKKDGTTTETVDERPYAPSHGPGNDPYLVREVGTVEDRRTAFTGEVHDH